MSETPEKPRLEWRPFSERFVKGERLYAGSMAVGIAHFNGARPKGDPKCYFAETALPGLKVRRADAETIDAAKAAVEKIVRSWFSAALA